MDRERLSKTVNGNVTATTSESSHPHRSPPQRSCPAMDTAATPAPIDAALPLLKKLHFRQGALFSH
jgi:hypothetical protein